MMLVGESGSGKTTLIQSLLGLEIEYLKTQALNYYNFILDTPGEYMESRKYYNSLLVSSANYDVVGLVQDSTSEKNVFPPNFTTMFSNKEILGIVTKADGANSDVTRAKEYLNYAGVENIIITNAFDETGLEDIKNFLRK